MMDPGADCAVEDERVKIEREWCEKEIILP